jgi:glycine betaine/proline transport system permease protein
MPNISLGDAVSDLIDWLTANAPWLFDGVSAFMSVLVNGLTGLLIGPPPWLWIVIFGLAGTLVKSRWFGFYTVVAFGLVLYMDLWNATMESLALVLLAALIAVMIGIPLGILTARSRPVRVIARPILDVMQTAPVFVYLIPAVFFFGVGVVPGVVATTIFAIPPGVRLTELGIRQVDREIVEAARAFGAKPRQVLREVQLPLALPSIMAGVNQVIMLALSMVVVAGLTGAQGLGAVVVQAVTQLDVASGFEGGLAVVLLAIFLDRVTSAVAAPRNGGGFKRKGRNRRDGEQVVLPATSSEETTISAPDPASQQERLQVTTRRLGYDQA